VSLALIGMHDHPGDLPAAHGDRHGQRSAGRGGVMVLRDGARQPPGPRRVVALRLRLRRAPNPCSVISAATVFLLTCHPASFRSAAIIGEARLPWCRPNSCLRDLTL
jgi:hypothetical protein